MSRSGGSLPQPTGETDAVDSVVGLTAAELERATLALIAVEATAGLIDIADVTFKTMMLSTMLQLIGKVSPEAAVKAAYHHGLRIGLMVARLRASADPPPTPTAHPSSTEPPAAGRTNLKGSTRRTN